MLKENRTYLYSQKYFVRDIKLFLGGTAYTRIKQ